MAPKVTCLVDCRCTLAESPVWDDRAGVLWWVDILGKMLYRLAMPSGALDLWPMPQPVTALGLCESDRLVLALADGVYLFDPDTEELVLLARPEPDRPTNRLNDGKVGPDGAFWIGSMDDRPDRQPVAALYRITADGSVEQKVDGLTVSNGLAWTADGHTLFHSDSRGPWIDRYTFDPDTGALSARTRIATLDDQTGRPDGGTFDAEGFYWSAGVTAGRLNRFAADGRLVQHISLRVPRPTMPCFGGPGLKTLFVTSMRDGLEPARLAAAPLSGSILAIDIGIAGFPAFRFKD